VSDFSKEELQSMIDRYRRDFMEQYASAISVPPPDKQSSTIPSQETNASDLIDIGQLQIRTATGNQAIPIAGAVVTVTNTDDDSRPIVLVTDKSGLTPVIDLPAKDRALSLSPDNPSPFTAYHIIVTADGYLTKEFPNIPIYGGVTAIQSVTMVPVPEGGDNDMPLMFPTTPKE